MNIKNELIKEYEVKSYEVNCNNELKPAYLFHFLEDIAYESAENLGFGYSDVYTRGLAWFVVKYRLKLDKMPKAWEKIKIKTWPIANKGITCRRDFEIYKNDEKIGCAASLWTVVDINSKRLLNPFKTLNFPELDDKKALDTDFEKVETIEGADFKKEITIRFDDTDLNGHVNNSNYISWAQDTMGYDFLKTHTAYEINIDFKKESTADTEKVISLALYNKDGCYSVHSLMTVNGEELAHIKIKWK